MRILVFCTFLLFYYCDSSTAEAKLPQDSEYITINNGHLQFQDKRIRLWGAVAFNGWSYADNIAYAKRLKSLGYNLVRFWNEPRGDGNYQKGDGSQNDYIDHFLWCCKQEGIFVWYACLNNLGKINDDDVKVINDKASEKEWQNAIGSGVEIRGHLARIWDPRIEQVALNRMAKIVNHVNHYTELRYGDDPMFPIWELANEEWWFGHVTASLPGLPQYFQNEITNFWNGFLKSKYQNDDNLLKAWIGLLPGESLAKNSILLVPLKQDISVDRQRKALGVNITEGIEKKYGINDFNRQRGADVVEFLVKIWLKHKQKEHNIIKSSGKAITRGALIWDTGIGNEIQAQFMHQNADAVAHCTYLGGLSSDSTHMLFPWYSSLTEPPRMCWDSPWVEQNRVEGKPFFLYETQISNPAKYRAEYSMRVASLASIQDWDVIVWHTMGGFAPDSKREKPYDNPLDYSYFEGGPAEGLHFRWDEVQQSSMTAAAEAFKNFHLQPAPHPTRFLFGKNSLYDPSCMEYGGSYSKTMRMFIPTTYRYGMRMFIDTTRLDDEIIGPVCREGIFPVNPVKPNNEIEYNWHKGFLKFDSPGVAMFTGFLADYGESIDFLNGIKVSHVTFNNPYDISYPIRDNEKFLELCVVSKTESSIIKSDSLFISLVSTSFNSGFKLDHSKVKGEFDWWNNPGAIVNRGHLPVLVVRVGATIECPAFNGFKYKFIDWQLKTIKKGIIKDGKLIIPDSLPIFGIEIIRNKQIK